MEVKDDMTPNERLTEELTEWWLDQAKGEIDAVVPKAVEYGAADLRVMGMAMQALLPEDSPIRGDLEAMDQLGQEMAVAFYLLGKVSRLFGAYQRGEPASDDTWHDAAVYTRMGQHIRQTGGWV